VKNKPVQVGEMIRYVICKSHSSTTSSDQNTNNNNIMNEENSNTSLAARAFHPDDVKEQNLQIGIKNDSFDALKMNALFIAFHITDIEWYMETQILPPILRLVEPIEGTNSALIAHCLGMNKFYWTN
jgi:DNA polymerase elongation subunit (family B)